MNTTASIASLQTYLASRAIYAAANEPGLLVGKISEFFNISSYKGRKSLTEKKIFRDLFRVRNQCFFFSNISFCFP